MGTHDTLRTVLEAGRTSKRLDELTGARIVGKVAAQVYAAQQKAGAGKAIGPIAPAMIGLAAGGAISLALGEGGSVLGYTAPERLSGGAGERRSDVFSLGVVLWELLTNQRLFEAMSDAAVRAAVAEREIKPPAEVNANVPAELSAICMKALARNAADRYGSAKAMGVEIEEFLDEAGYPDSDEKLAEYLAQLPRAAAEPAPAVAPPAHLGTLPPIEQVAAYAPPVVAAPPVAVAEPAPASPAAAAEPAPKPEPAPAPVTPRPPVLPDNPRATIASAAPPPPTPPRDTVPDGQIAAAMKDVEAAPQPVTGTGSAPHPASVVSLPGRDSRTDVLASWAWQTDSHEALADEDDEYAAAPSRKPLVYVIGGGLALAAIVTIIAVGFGGSKPKKKAPPAPAAAMTESTTAPATVPAQPAPPAPAAQPPAAPAVAQTAPAAGSAETATAGSAGSVDTVAAGSAGSGSATSMAATTPAPAPAPAEPAHATEPPAPAPAPAETHAKHEPEKVAHADTSKNHKHGKGQLADPFAGNSHEHARTTHARSDAPKVDVENLYRVGLQQFARGDTSGALASLRTSLAANPGYPPTWRGLGLVFEKLGEKEQARAAFRRYLQLAPKASDADFIRSRLERLGS